MKKCYFRSHCCVIYSCIDCSHKILCHVSCIMYQDIWIVTKSDILDSCSKTEQCEVYGYGGLRFYVWENCGTLQSYVLYSVQLCSTWLLSEVVASAVEFWVQGALLYSGQDFKASVIQILPWKLLVLWQVWWRDGGKTWHFMKVFGHLNAMLTGALSNLEVVAKSKFQQAK